MRWLVGPAAAALVLGTAACGGDDSTPADGGGVDSGGPVDGGGTADGGGMDAGGEVDAGGEADAGGGVDAGPPAPCEPPTLPALDIEDIAPGHTFDNPVYVTQAPGAAELWVVEQRGRIRVVQDGTVLDPPFLDIRSDVTFGGERGLLGLAFHPDYESNGRFFVYYTPSDAHQNVVAEYHVSDSDPLVADGTEVQRLMEITDPQDNHNGGMITFGPDGFLYVGTGDGGGGGDDDTGHGTFGNGQNTDVLLAKLLRLDPDAPGADFAAAGNPFEGGGGLPQVWAYGLRNPWRFSFDQRTGDLYIGDVGQGTWEEIDIQDASSTGGENYGWRAYEGYSVYSAADVGLVTEHAEPVLAVEHSRSDELLRNACSITGGFVYRGAAIPDLRGVYFFGDYCSPDVGAFRWCEGAVMGEQRVTDLTGAGSGLASFGQDNAGEVYIVYRNDGLVAKLVPGG